MTVTSGDIANQALQYSGDNQPPVTGVAPNFDNSTAGIALQQFYGPCVASVARQSNWDMARNTVALTLSGNVPETGYLYEYLYPSNGIEIWQLVPATIADANNPLPTTWNVCNTIVGTAQTKVIQTNLQNALCVYNNNPGPDVWDPLFREAVVRLLASVLAMAIAGRPDTAQAYLESGAAFESIGERRSD